MADERLEVLLKARIDTTNTNDLQVQATAVGKKLEPINLGIKIDTQKAEQSFYELKKVMESVKSMTVFDKDGITILNQGEVQKVEKFKSAIGQMVSLVENLNIETGKTSSKIDTASMSLEKQNQLRDKATKLQDELNIAMQKFDSKGLSDLYKLGDNLDINSVETLRDSLKNIKINADGSNLDEALTAMKSINKEYSLLNVDANLNKKINDDISRQKEKDLDLYKKSVQAQQELNILSKNFDTKSLGALYNLGDNLDLNAIQKLQDRLSNIKIEANDESIEKAKTEMSLILKTFGSITDASKLQKKINDDILAQEEKSKQEQLNKLKFIEKQTLELNKLENNVKNLQSVKGLDGTDYLKSINDKRQELSTFSGSDLALTKEQEYSFKSSLDILKNTVSENKANLEVERKRNELTAEIEANIQNAKSINVKYDGADNAKIDSTVDGLEKLKTGVKNNEVAIETASTTNKKFTNSIKEIEMQAKDTSSATATLGDRLKKAFQYFTFYDALRLGQRAVKEMISTVTKLDTAMYNIQMVTGGTRKETEALMLSYNKLGKELGATTLEVSTSANEFLRQGKTIEETNTLIKNAMILSKVGMISSSDSTAYLTSSMKGFNIEADKSLEIIDKLSAVDMVSATSAGGLAQAMSRTASSARLANVEIDKLIGYIATVGEVTQKDMASIGESFKTMFSRMGNVKLGQFIDEDGNDMTTQISDVEKVLSKVDIKLRSSATEFRDFGLVLDDVGKNWKSFNDVEKNAIATTFAGRKNVSCLNIQ